MNLSRRKLLAALAGLPLPGGMAGWARRGYAAFRPQRTNAHVVSTVTSVVDRLIPTDDLPGAVALKIDQHIVAKSDVQRLLAAGVNWLDAYARRLGAADFRGLDEAGQLAAMTAGWAAQNTEVEQMLSTLWFHSATLYYSQPVVQQAYAYAGAPQPAGFADFQQAPR